MMLPFVTCLCPTYKRPRLLENAIACFLMQRYPIHRRRLVILDDAGQIPAQKGLGWELFAFKTRIPSMPQKHDTLVSLAPDETEIFVLWDDDDIYLPWHISAHVEALAGGAAWSRPSRVLSLYTGRLETEDGEGRFHAALAFRRQLVERIGGWPATQLMRYDQMFIASLRQHGGEPGDPLAHDPRPGFCFRWNSTGAYHAQHFSEANWYQEIGSAAIPADPVGRLNPLPDAETAAVIAGIRQRVS